MIISPVIKAIFCVVVAVWLTVPVSVAIPGDYTSPMEIPCPSGISSAKLTGWTLNSKTPVGSAKYNEITKLLEISIESVDLPDGKVLTVLIGEDSIGQLAPLKGGTASGSIMRSLPENARVRVLDADRPVVSANLLCVEAPKLNPLESATVSPSPLPSPTPSPTVSPSPSVTPAPTAEPTQDPMPKKTPVPTPTPVD